MAKLMAMFPGQGSQYVGMGKDLVKEFPRAKQIFEEASDAISLDIKTMCFDGPESELTLTANTQPCILTHSIAVWNVLQNETEVSPSGFAGHSLGEYSAIVAAGVISLADAVKLVRRRGEAMQSAVAPGVGGMAAILNSDVSELEAICKKESKEGSIVEPVNYNSPQQVVIAGHKSGVDRVCNILEEKNIKCVTLQVSAPFHSSLMTKAKEAMKPSLSDVAYKRPSALIIPNLDAEPTTSYSEKYLIDQIDHAVKWSQTMTKATELEFDHFLEVGPGKVLFGLARRSLPKGVQLLVSENLKDTIEKLKALK